MENSQSEKAGFFADVSWKSALICAVISIVAGGSVGGGVVASKGIKVEGLSQNEADIRYLTIEAADKRTAKRDAQTDRIENKIDDLTKKLDEKYVRKDIFDQNNEGVKSMLNQILENQKELKNSKSY